MQRPVPEYVPEGIPFGWWDANSMVYPSPAKTHKGKDWRAFKDTPCWFREPGTITFAGLLGELGLYCQMRSKYGVRWWGLAHLSRIDIQPGRDVAAGELVALTGGIPGEFGAGLSDGQHLHEEVRVDWQWGERVDPDSVMEEDMAEDLMAEIERALGVLWGWAEALEKPPGLKLRARQRQAAKELKDAIVSIKTEVGIN